MTLVSCSYGVLTTRLNPHQSIAMCAWVLFLLVGWSCSSFLISTKFHRHLVVFPVQIFGLEWHFLLNAYLYLPLLFKLVVSLYVCAHCFDHTPICPCKYHCSTVWPHLHMCELVCSYALILLTYISVFNAVALFSCIEHDYIHMWVLLLIALDHITMLTRIHAIYLSMCLHLFFIAMTSYTTLIFCMPNVWLIYLISPLFVTIPTWCMISWLKRPHCHNPSPWFCCCLATTIGPSTISSLYTLNLS